MSKYSAIVGIIMLSCFLVGCMQNPEMVATSVEVVQDVSDNEDKSSELSEVSGELNGYSVQDGVLEYEGKQYQIIEVDGGDRSGSRESNVAVDVGFGAREYWALTNEYGQLVYVIAENIVLQDDEVEAVNSDGRYYDDEADVPGTEEEDLDQGHVIADSLGGVANAYNITPQESTLNRHGDQAYMEESIRVAGGCTNFVARILYPDESTQIPNSYRFEYDLKGNKIIDEFANVNPDEAYKEEIEAVVEDAESKVDVTTVDTNGNGIVTIAEAEAAGYTMPINSKHWLYPYMSDGDGDGLVGE